MESLEVRESLLMLLAREMRSPRRPAEIKRAQQEIGRCQQNSAKVVKRHGHGRGRTGQCSAGQGRHDGQGRAGQNRDTAGTGHGTDRVETEHGHGTVTTGTVQGRTGQSREGADRG